MMATEVKSMSYRDRQRLVKSLREIRDGLNEYQQFICAKGFTGWPITAAARRLDEIAQEVENGLTNLD
jgi:hypothetical protein